MYSKYEKSEEKKLFKKDLHIIHFCWMLFIWFRYYIFLIFARKISSQNNIKTYFDLSSNHLKGMKKSYICIFNFFFNTDFILVSFVTIPVWDMHVRIKTYYWVSLLFFYFNVIICMYYLYFQRYPTDRAYFIAKEILMTERTYKKDLEILNLVSHFLHYYINYVINPCINSVWILALKEWKVHWC